MSRSRVCLSLAIVLALGCEPDVGACDVEAATAPLYFDEGGYPAYPGQALVDVSCGAGLFCHAQGIEADDRLGAPAGLDLDVAVALDAEGLERLRRARRVAWNLRHSIHGQVSAGLMPPPPPAGDASTAAAARYRALIGTPDERTLPSIDSDEGREILRNWLACGAHVVEGVEGESQGVGDIVPQGTDSSCAAGQASCGDVCIDVTADPSNCGACGRACGDGQVCQASACRCTNELEACGALCVDTETDVSHCGSCGNSCGDLFCAEATCVDSCPSGATDCGGSCVNLMTNLANCGGCGAACAAGESCVGAQCSCASGFTQCGSRCVDVLRDPGNCGACGAACEGGAACDGGACACAAPTTLCGATCVDTSTDLANCGACANACAAGEGCASGACVGCGPEVHFAADVEPMLVSRCTSSGCHGGARPAASLSLIAGRAYSELVGPLASCGGRSLVVPGDVEGSYLWNKLTDSDICSGTQMPKRGESLAAAELDIVRSWICRGAAND